MDVCLSNYGHCNYISSHHACIFIDKVRDLVAIVITVVSVVMWSPDVAYYITC